LQGNRVWSPGPLPRFVETSRPSGHVPVRHFGFKAAPEFGRDPARVADPNDVM
jgi:hypothetical protein